MTRRCCKLTARPHLNKLESRKCTLFFLYYLKDLLSFLTIAEMQKTVKFGEGRGHIANDRGAYSNRGSLHWSPTLLKWTFQTCLLCWCFLLCNYLTDSMACCAGNGTNKPSKKSALLCLWVKFLYFLCSLIQSDTKNNPQVNVFNRKAKRLGICVFKRKTLSSIQIQVCVFYCAEEWVCSSSAYFLHILSSSKL